MEQVEEQAQHVSFLHVSSRIGRLRYFAYGIALSWLELPFLIGSLAALLQHHVFWYALLTVITYLFFVPIHFTFIIRRLHDMDRSGWLSLIYGAAMLLNLIRLFHHSSVLTALYALFGLAVLVFLLMFVLIMAGTITAIFSYQAILRHAQMAESVAIAISMEQPAVESYRDNKVWPLEPSQLSGPHDPSEAPGRYLADVTSATAPPDGQSYGIVAMMKSAGVASDIAGRSFEVWTTDGGETWHCGPGGESPMEPDYLPESCRDEGALPP